MDYILAPNWVFVVNGLCLLVGGGCIGALITIIIEGMKNGK